MRKMTKETPNF